ncbi:MAG TPA: hypothetical protein VFO73_08410 [Candidatus Limnocylindrales bacterium]|nr:hypothetical protein [Candidatus Limnocylindrales bacterium]
MPEYADEILEQTIRTRQRPRWTFASRWLPIGAVVPTTPATGRISLRSVGLLVILALILAAVAAVVGSRPKLPPPFGLAGNGLLAYNPQGDVALLDPETMVSRTIVLERNREHDPRWSADGTRLAFLRETGTGLVLVVVDSAGEVQAVTETFTGIDSDSIAWSPDGRSIAIGGEGPQGHAIYLVDAADGTARPLAVDYDHQEAYWRPPDGDQLLFRAAGTHPGLAIVSIADGSVVRVPTSSPESSPLRPMGWTPDGRAVLYQDDSSPDLGTTTLKDIETGTETTLGVGFGHVSNGGTHVAGVDRIRRFCIIAITGGTCRVIPVGVEVDGSFAAGVSWSPDDRWIAVSAAPGEPVWLVDPTGAVRPRVVAASGPGSWQRLALP